MRPVPVLSWPIIVSASIYSLLLLYVFNDYMQNIPGEYVSVRSVETAAPYPYYSLPVPPHSYVPPRDGDVLLVGP